jgi:hypothetical protein
MTRKDLVDYLLVNGCEMDPLPENSVANAVKFHNPATRRTTYIYTPIDNRKMLPATICQVCTQLGIEVPHYAEDANDVIQNIHRRFNQK